MFSGSSEKAKALEAGDIFVVHGLVLAKVSNVKEIGGNISISYLPAKLTEAISNGEIEWNVTTDFTKAEEITVIMPGKGNKVFGLEPGVTDFTYTGKFGEYTYKIDLGLGKDEMEVKFDIKKEIW